MMDVSRVEKNKCNKIEERGGYFRSSRLGGVL